jgi:hypothetical protein
MTDERGNGLTGGEAYASELGAEFEPGLDTAETLEFDPEFDPSVDPIRDPALAAALRELDNGEAPHPDWDRLRQSIRAAAAPRLARRQSTAHWWQHAASWASHAIPIGLAASIALAIGLGTLAPGGAAPEPAGTPEMAFESMLAIVFDEAQELSIPVDGDELLRAAIQIED